MTRYRVEFRNGRRPMTVEADWYRRLGDFIHFFVRRTDGGGQTVWRFPVDSIAAIRQERTK